jgi:hypothetical protein
MDLDPILEALLLALARTAPTVIHVVSDALRGGDTPEQAVAKAKAATPVKLDTTFEDEARRARIRGAGGGT